MSALPEPRQILQVGLTQLVCYECRSTGFMLSSTVRWRDDFNNFHLLFPFPKIFSNDLHISSHSCSVRYRSFFQFLKCFIRNHTLLTGRSCCKRCFSRLKSTGVGLDGSTCSQKSEDVLYNDNLSSAAAAPGKGFLVAVRLQAHN